MIISIVREATGRNRVKLAAKECNADVDQWEMLQREVHGIALM